MDSHRSASLQKNSVAAGKPKSYFAELHRLAVELATNSVSCSLTEWETTFAYKDLDGDVVAIVSNQDVQEALDHFGEKSFKILTTVTKKTITKDVACDASVSAASVSTQTACQASRKSTASDNSIDMDKVAGSIVDALAAGVLSVSDHVQKVSEQVAKKAKEEAKPATSSPKQAPRAAPQPAPRAAPQQAPRVAQPSPPPRPFIHGRHTCDQCLASPILGTRYHATNLPDYDLCSRCFANYQGAEVTFEEAVADRDFYQQDRWNRRFARCHRPGRNNYRRGGRRVPRPPPPVISRRQEAAPRQETARAPTEDQDLAMKEAIRRSLEDMKTKPSEEIKDAVRSLKPDAPATEKQEATKEDAPYDSPPCQGFSVQSRGPAESPFQVVWKQNSCRPIDFKEAAELAAQLEATSGIEKITAPHPSAPESPKSQEFFDDAEGSGEVAAVLGEALDKVANAIDDFTHELSRDNQDDEDNTWDMVSDGNKSDLARAAEMIGSSLYSSGIQEEVAADGQEDVSALENDSSLNSDAPLTVDSVPTTVHSLEARTERWAGHLVQLHELGFHDDAAMVEILEGLEASHIGADLEEEVKIEAVIEKLSNDW